MLATWRLFCTEAEFDKADNKRLMKRIDTKQVLLLKTPAGYRACANQCPHQGYPLSEGCLDHHGRLTCQWHNWKFDLDSGQSLFGGDTLPTYPVRAEGGEIWVNLTPHSPAERVNKTREHLRAAFSENAYDQICREIARLMALDVAPTLIATWVIEWSWQKFDYGTTHAYAGLNDWLVLSEKVHTPEDQLICLTEAVGHVAHDAHHRPDYPFDAPAQPFSTDAFLAAIEQEDEHRATALTKGALAAAVPLSTLEAVYSAAALSHYIGFGHGLIYVAKMFELLDKLSSDSHLPILLNLTRYLVYAQREDLIPDYRPYASHLQQWGSSTTQDSAHDSKPDWARWATLGLHPLMTAVQDASAHAPPEQIYQSLLLTNVHHLQHYDTALETATAVSVAKSSSWLNVTHGLTFANAVRQQCQKFPTLWPQGLLQMACFAGRNKGFTQPATHTAADVGLPEIEIDTLVSKVLDHGLDDYIQSVHKLKVLIAGLAEAQEGDTQTKRLIGRAISRYILSPIKGKHTRRHAYQSLMRVRAEGV